MENVVDSLQIDIVSTQTEASKSLDAVVSSLKKLDRISKSNSFNLLRKQLKGLAGVSFDKLQRQLNSITKNIKTLKSYKDFMNNLSLGNPTIDTSGITAGVDNAVSEVNRAAEAVVNVGESFGESVNARPEWLDDMQSQCDTIIETFGVSTETINATKDRILNMLGEKAESYGSESAFIGATDFTDTLGDKLQKLSIQANLLKEKMASMVESGNVDSTQWQKLQKELISTKLQYEQLEQAANRHARAVDGLGKSVEKTKKPLGKLISNFAKVAMYRAIRFVLSQIMNAITEGFQNLAKFSAEANKTMSAYKTEFTYVKNSLGSALMPIMASLLPTVVRLGDAFADICDSVGIISAWIGGDKTFLRATKYAQNYKRSLDDIKRATSSFDEINVLSKVDTNSDYTQMFEEVDISGGEIAGAFGKIALAVAAVTAALTALKGTAITAFFATLGVKVLSLFGTLKAMSGLKFKEIWYLYNKKERFAKTAKAVALLALEFILVKNTVHDMITGNKSLGEGLLALIPICAVVGVAMYAMWGPVGLIIGVVVAAVGAFIGAITGVAEKAKDREMEKFWKVTGVAIEDCTNLVHGYLQALGISKQEEWNQTLAAANEELTDAIFSYNTLFATIQGDNISTKKIEQLGEAFQNLADAAKAVNEAAIGSLMASIKTGIELNITPELTGRLAELVNSLEVTQDILNTQIDGINGEYQGILNDIKNNGGNVTDAQRAELERLKGEMSKYTLSNNSSTETWNRSMTEAKNTGINAGFDKDAVTSALDDLVEDRETYLDVLATNYDSSVSTMRQLIALGLKDEQGNLLYTDADLAVLAQNYNAQVQAVVDQFNAVVEGIYNGLNENAITEDFAWYELGFAWLYDWDLYGRNSAKNEQQDILKMINKYKKNADDLKVEVPAHANGGVVEDGFFMANHTEIVGKFRNGKTVAANNMQVIEGIKQGVSEAMQESGGNGGDWVIQIVDTDGRVKGETIVTAAERKNRRDGKTVISVGG